MSRRRKGKSGATPRPSILVTPFILLLLSRARAENLLPPATAGGARVPPVSWANPTAATWRETLGGPRGALARPSLRRAPGNAPALQSRGGGSGSGRKSGACSLYKDILYKEADGVAGGRVCLPEAMKKPEPARAAVATANKGGDLTGGPGARPRPAERKWSGEEQASKTKGRRPYRLL